MPDHGSRYGRGRPAAAATVAAALLLAASSCSPADRGPVRRVAIDSAAPTPPGDVSRPAPDSAVPAGSAADSAARLDALFQERRTAINRDARALESAGLDRRSAEYAARYDDLRRRTMAAESLRSARDVLRRR